MRTHCHLLHSREIILFPHYRFHSPRLRFNLRSPRCSCLQLHSLLPLHYGAHLFKHFSLHPMFSTPSPFRSIAASILNEPESAPIAMTIFSFRTPDFSLSIDFHLHYHHRYSNTSRFLTIILRTILSPNVHTSSRFDAFFRPRPAVSPAPLPAASHLIRCTKFCCTTTANSPTILYCHKAPGSVSGLKWRYSRYFRTDSSSSSSKIISLFIYLTFLLFGVQTDVLSPWIFLPNLKPFFFLRNSLLSKALREYF